MVKSFYDLKIEKRGMERGIEQGKIKTAENLLKMGISTEQIAKATELSLEKIEGIKKKMIIKQFLTVHIFQKIVV